MLTRGFPLSWYSVLSSFSPAENTFTGAFVDEDGDRKAVGQVHQSSQISSAQIQFVLAGEAQQDELTILLEGLCKEAGGWGAKQVIAELAPDSLIYPAIRQAGFRVFGKQRLYRFQEGIDSTSGVEGHWRIWNSNDIQAMRVLYQALVPPLIQPVEPLTRLEMLGLVFYDEGGELQAFADLVYGPIGIWVLPFIHPQSTVEFSALLGRMIQDLPERNRRPVYVVARSYQPWVETALDFLDGERGLEEALLVKYLAYRQPVTADLAFGALENGAVNPHLPVAPIHNDQH